MKMESTLQPKNKASDGLALILASLKNIRFGQLELILPQGEALYFSGSQAGPAAKMRALDVRVFDCILARSDIGLGEAYMEGLWQTDDISSLIEFAVVNRNALAGAMLGQWHKVLIYKVKHMFNLNSKSGSRKNISAHYDLGNDFYKLWLDETMTYSSAQWAGDRSLSLAQAQKKKYELLLGHLNAKKGSRILEIGCGWGGFAEYAAKNGHHVTGITISRQQFDFATARMKRQNLQDRVDIQFLDYRDLKGQYDHVVSIEMLEAVGAQFWHGYFKKITEVLKPGGSVAIQSITISDTVFASYRKGTDFIQQYIFPGGMLPCERELKTIVGGLNHCEVKFTRFGLDYAHTLKIWAAEFEKVSGEVRRMGYSAEFERMWKFYLGYCEGAFRAGQINVVAMVYSPGVYSPGELKR